ncbi:MAG: hypothetical protein XD95_0637 [Microgenomates bacterium 39_7]|nr:MAG: hypothetical protein XD95_0637 [Microgenomates bacterium 39_7]
MTAYAERSPAPSKKDLKAPLAAAFSLIAAGMLFFAKDSASSRRVSIPDFPNPTPIGTISPPTDTESSKPTREPYRLQPEQTEIVKSTLGELLKKAFADWEKGVAITQIATTFAEGKDKGVVAQLIAFVTQIINEYLSGEVVITDEILLQLMSEITNDPARQEKFMEFLGELFRTILFSGR